MNTATKREQRMVKGLRQLWRKHFTDKQYLAFLRSGYMPFQFGPKGYCIRHTGTGEQIENISNAEVLQIIGA